MSKLNPKAQPFTFNPTAKPFIPVPINTPPVSVNHSHPISNHFPVNPLVAPVPAPVAAPPPALTPIVVLQPITAAATSQISSSTSTSPAASPASSLTSLPKLRAAAPVFVPGGLKPASPATTPAASTPAVANATVNKAAETEAAAAAAAAAKKAEDDKAQAQREQEEKEEKEKRDREEKEVKDREEKEKIEREEKERKAREERERKEKEDKEKREKEEKDRKEKEEKERRERAQTFLPKGLPTLNIKKPTITLSKPANAERSRLPKTDAADEHADVPDAAITRDIAEKADDNESKPKDEKIVAVKDDTKENSESTIDTVVAQFDATLKVYSKEWLLSVKNSPHNAAFAKRLEEVKSVLDSMKLLESGSYDSQSRRQNQSGQQNGKDWERGSKLAPERGKGTSRPFDSNNQHRSGKDHGYGNQRRERSEHDRARKGGLRKEKDEPLLKESEVKPLAMSDNRYKVLKDVKIDEKLVRDITFILNRVTKDNFDLMLDRAKELSVSIDKPAALRDIVHAFFEKALDEPIFAPIYAEFALKLGVHLPSFAADEQDTQNTENFRRLLLNRCQAEFEDVEQAVDPEKLAKMTKEEKEEFDAKQKRRQLGAIRFIGELYARGMLNSTVIKDCIIQLLGDLNTPDEVDIEALSKLLETVGKKFDAKQNRPFVDELFKSLEAIRTGGKISSRIRFMIQNTAELRERQWIQRTQKEEPKKIAEIHKAEKPVKPKAPNTARAGAAAAMPISRGGVKKDRYALMIEKKDKKEEKKEDDGFVEVKSSRKTPTLQRNKSATGGAAAPKNGKNDSAKKAAGDDGGEHHINAFSALGDEDEEHEDYAEAEGEDESVDDADDAADDLEDDVVELDDSRVKELSEEYVKKYFSSEDEKSALELIRSNLAEKGARMPVFIKTAVRDCFDRKERELELLPRLIKFLADDGALMPEDVEDGLEEIFGRLDDYINDNPKAPEYVGSLVGSLSALDVYSLRILATSSKVKNLEDEHKFQLTAAAAIAYRSKKDEAALVDAWKKAKLSAEFLGVNTTKAREFATKKGLDAIAAIL